MCQGENIGRERVAYHTRDKSLLPKCLDRTYIQENGETALENLTRGNSSVFACLRQIRFLTDEKIPNPQPAKKKKNKNTVRIEFFEAM